MSAARLNGALLVMLLLALFASAGLGATSLGIEAILMALAGAGEAVHRVVIWEIRLPRGVNAAAVGMALGMSGAALQGLLRNPLAEPGVLGVSASASLGATLVIYYGLVNSWAFAMPLGAVLGALLATALIAWVALRGVSMVTLILVGVGLSSFAGACLSLLMNFAPHPFTLADLVNWTLGSVANRSFIDLAFSLPFLAVGAALLWGSRNGLVALSLGEEAAAGVGLNLSRQRLLVVTGAGLATGGAVALAGAIGFVGIVAPHIVRPLLHHDPARSLLPSALAGGLLVLLADIAIRVLPTASELKLGVVAAVVGAPAFVWIAMRRTA